MSPFTVPVSMIASKGAGGAFAVGVIGLLILLAIAAKADPKASTNSVRG